MYYTWKGGGITMSLLLVDDKSVDVCGRLDSRQVVQWMTVIDRFCLKQSMAMTLEARVLSAALATTHCITNVC